MKAKKVSLLALCCIGAHFSMGQNAFPATGNVGIGVSPSAHPLHIKGSSPITVFEETDVTPDKKWHIGGSNSGLVIAETGVSNVMYFEQGGQVGIGDVTPDHTLDVNGTFRVVDDATFDSDVQIAQTGELDIKAKEQFSGVIRPSPSTGYDLILSSTSNPGEHFGMAYDSQHGVYMGFENNSVGLVTLQGYLSVYEDVLVSGKVQVSHVDVGQTIEIQSTSFTSTKIEFGSYGEIENLETITSSDDIVIDAPSLQIGNTPNPSSGIYGLAVDKKIICNGILVQNPGNWPDYVFDEDYELQPIEDMKVYVEENGHLPNVPDAEEIENEGLSLEEVVRVQMEKIEELSLYIIQLNEELNEVKTLVKK